jgi:hypothetical protein
MGMHGCMGTCEYTQTGDRRSIVRTQPLAPPACQEMGVARVTILTVSIHGLHCWKVLTGRGKTVCTDCIAGKYSAT